MIMEIPLWKKTTLSPKEYSDYSGLSDKTVYMMCQKKQLPCFMIGDCFKIHRAEADKKLAQLALTYEGHNLKETEEINVRRSRK